MAVPRRALIAVGLALGVGAGAPQAAEPRCPEPLGRVVSAQGRVELRPAEAERWQAVALEETLCPGDVLHVGPNGRAAVYLVQSEGVVRVDRNTTLRLVRAEEARSFLGLLEGAAHFFSRRPRALDVATPFVNAGVEGTEFFLRVTAERALLTVFQGRVAASNPEGRLVLGSGESAAVAPGAAPAARVVARPRDQVRWTLHYPPVLALTLPEDAPEGLRRAVEAWRRADHEAAFAALDAVPAARRDVRYRIHRAGLLLDVGRVDAARAEIREVLQTAPESGDAHALLSVIAIAGNRHAEALDEAERAVELAPDSPAARVALSYALQANLRLAEARDRLAEATTDFPGNALLWARLAELRLAFGNSQGALAAAETAERLTPRLSRTATVRGFARLARFQVNRAKRAFREAIRRDNAAPLPRLGLGLALIRDGELTAGRQEIEIAAALDPGNALVRSYLGKAYVEARRDKPAAEELATAKRLDPADPTPYYYDALRKQSENQPTEALADLQDSIARNDNRAVYRSRLLLDEDRAVRGASAARIHNDLGFERLAQLEASRSLALDPANHSAHRFLADSFRGSARQDIVNVSELLRAQLLQPLNVQPVQASRSETELNLASRLGPTEPGLNEFTPLFARDDLRFAATGFGGSDETIGDEVVLAGIQGRTSFSASQFHFETDGFRPNNQEEHDIVDLFGQVALTPEINLQAEYRHRETEQGDLRLDFDPDDFSEVTARAENEETARFGARVSMAPNIDLLGSFIYEDRKTSQTQELAPGLNLGIDSESDGWDAQTQAIWRTANANLTVGGSLAQVDSEQAISVGTFQGAPSTIETDQGSVYAYGNINMPADVVWTLGGSYEVFDDDIREEDQFNPKLGVRWDVTERVRLRAAAFRTLKRFLLADQTLEPTQIAGFTQFFDDFNATKGWRYGAGVDVEVNSRLFTGVEVALRDMDVPTAIDGEPVFLDLDETAVGGYLYWIPASGWAVDFEPDYLIIENPRIDGPSRLATVRLPLSLRYFREEGVFAQITGTLVHQDVNARPDQNLSADDTETFPVVDLGLGFRFPERRGQVSLAVENVFDESFKFQDLNFVNAGRDVTPDFIPDRRVLVQLTLTF